MATDVISVTGTVGWAKVYEPDTFMNATKWKLDFYPESEEEWAKLNKAGVQKKKRTNTNPEDGPVGDYIKLDRDAHKVIKGNMVHFSGPVILNNEGKVIVDYVDREENKRIYSFSSADKNKVERRGKPILIGNGSRVRVKIAVYDTIKGKGTRLEEVQVLDLIEYERSEKRELPPVLEDVRAPLEAKEENKPVENGNKLPW